jgi:hypothetical protein
MGTSYGQPNLFNRLVNKEDDYTQLLCNLMLRFDDLRHKLFTLLLSEKLAILVRSKTLSIQHTLPNRCGRPDIAILTDELCVLLEVKIEPNRGPTANQDCNETDLGGYIRFLSEDVQGRERWLVYLVPRDWTHLEKVSAGLKRLNGTNHPTIHTKIVYWEDVRCAIEDSEINAHNSFVEEFRALLAERFRPLTFTKEELFMSEPNDFLTVFETLRKLQVLMDKTFEKGVRRYKVEWERQTEDEYGFNFLHENKYLLWFGMWGEPWRRYRDQIGGTPPKLWFGVHHDWASAKLFSEMLPTDKRIDIDGTWIVSWISDDVLESASPIDRVWGVLDSLMERFLENRATVSMNPQ